MRGTQRLDFILRKQANQSHLRFGGQMVDLIEKNRSAFGLLQYPDAAIEGPGKSILFMSEQHRVQKAGRKSRRS